MLRNIRIRERLLFAFLVIVSFTLIIGVTGYISLDRVGNSGLKTIDNVLVLNDVYDYVAAVDAGVSTMLNISDVSIRRHTVQSTRDHAELALGKLSQYLEIQEQFSDVLSPGEMQDMFNVFEMYKEVYLPTARMVFDLVEQEKWEEARAIVANRLDKLYNSMLYMINITFVQYLQHSKIRAERLHENANHNSHVMLALVFASMLASIILASAVTKSIAGPLLKLGLAAEKVAAGDLDVQIERESGPDEIAALSRQVAETLYQMTQIQRLKLEKLQAHHEKEKAEASTRSKSDFLAKMSHEIRTPMNAVIGMAELALRENIPSAACEHIVTIKQAGQTLLSIINDILDFSKIESGKLEIVPADYFFASLINDIVSIIQMRVSESHVQFTVNIDCSIPNVLFGDEIRIRQIMLNLLSNAVKYTDDGFVALTIAGEAIDENTVNLVFEVADSGRGIKAEDMDRLFGDFVQFDLNNNRGVEGTGLGLAIVKNLVQAMNGNIDVQSEYGKGSTFTLTLPQRIRGDEKLAVVADPKEKRVLVYERREIHAGSIVRTLDNLGVESMLVSNEDEFHEKLSKEVWPFIFIAASLYESVKERCSALETTTKIVVLTGFGETVAKSNLSILALPAHVISVTNALNGDSGGFVYGDANKSVVRFVAPETEILVVDDINTNLNVIQGLLQPYKMQVKLCQSGEEAIGAIAAKKFDLVFMDHMMPAMDGIEATRRIRALEGDDSYFKNVPIIALTANAVSGTKEMFLENGFNDFLSKPIDLIRLDTLLATWIPDERRKRFVSESSPSPNAPEDSAENHLRIDGLDVKKGIALSRGNIEHYMRTLAIFHRDGLMRIEQVQQTQKADELSLFTTYVHALKSATANVGAGELSVMAQALEAAGNQNDFAFIQTNTPKFISALESLLNNINAVLKANVGNERTKKVDWPLLKDELTSLHEAIVHINPRAIMDGLKNIQPFAQAADVGDAVEKILQSVSIGEYDDAAAMIKTLLSSQDAVQAANDNF